LANFIGKVVAVVLEYLISLLAKSWQKFFEQLHEELFRYLSLSERDSFSGLTERCPAWQIKTDATTIIKLFVVSTKTSVPNSIDLPIDKLL